MSDQTQAPEYIEHATTYEAMRAVKREIGVIGKTRTAGENSSNTDFKYAFRGYEELLEVASPLFEKHGLLTIPVMVGAPEMAEYQTGRSGATMHWARVPMAVHFRATADPEDVIVGGPFWGEAADSGDKAASKAQTVAYREIMFKTFSVPTRGGEYDTEPDSEDKAAASQADREAAAAAERLEEIVARGWESEDELDQAFESMKGWCTGTSESAEWARAWAKGRTKGKITPSFVAEMEVTLTEGAKKDGDWKANYTPPDPAEREAF